MPLPKITASASLANSSGRCACTVTPFIEVTSAAGHASSAVMPSAFSRLMRPRAMNEPSSLKPSKVRMATRKACSLFEQGPQHPGRLLMDVHALRQQVGGGLVVAFLGGLEHRARGARHAFVPLGQDAHH